MNHIKKFEELDIDRFKSFLNKHKKSEYVSTTDSKRLSDIGISDKNFLKIKEKIIKCHSFLRNNDLNTLEDLFIDVTDNCPVMSDIEYKFSLIVHPINSGRSNEYGFRDNLDPFNIDSLVNADIIKIVEYIVDRTEIQKNSEIQKYIGHIDDMKSKRPGVTDSWHSSILRRLKSGNYYESLKINPCILITFNLEGVTDNFNNLDYVEAARANRLKYDQIAGIKNDVNLVAIRYLSSIGHPNIKFTTTYGNNSYSGYYKIEFDLG